MYYRIMLLMYLLVFTFSDPCTGVQCGLGSCRAEKHRPVCFCQEGYSVQNGRCVDIDECKQKPCHSTAKCTNVPGGFKCACSSGQVKCNDASCYLF